MSYWLTWAAKWDPASKQHKKKQKVIFVWIQHNCIFVHKKLTFTDLEKVSETHFGDITFCRPGPQWRDWKIDKHVMRWDCSKWSGNFSLSLCFRMALFPDKLFILFLKPSEKKLSAWWVRVHQPQQCRKPSKYITAFLLQLAGLPLMKMEKYNWNLLKRNALSM